MFHKKRTVQTSEDVGRPHEISFSVICVGTQLILLKVSLVDVPYQWQYFNLFIIQKILGHVAKRFGCRCILFCGISFDFVILAEILLEIFGKNWQGAKYNHIYEFPLLNTEGSKVKKNKFILNFRGNELSPLEDMSPVVQALGTHDLQSHIWWPRIVRFACSEGSEKN